LTEKLVRDLSRTQVFAEISCLAPKGVEPFVDSAIEIGREANASYHLCGVLQSLESRNSLKLTLLDVASGKVLWGSYSEGSTEEFITIDTILLSSLTHQASQAIVCNEDNLRSSLRSVGDRESQNLVITSISLSLDVIELPIVECH
jgi:TolB-like protein